MKTTTKKIVGTYLALCVIVWGMGVHPILFLIAVSIAIGWVWLDRQKLKYERLPEPGQHSIDHARELFAKGRIDFSTMEKRIENALKK